MEDFLELLSAPGIDAYTSGLKFTLLSDAKKKIKYPDKKEIILDKTALFSSDKMLGWLDRQESRGLLWIKNDIEEGIVDINFSENGVDHKVVLEILKSNSKMNLIIIKDKDKKDKDKIVMNIEIKVEARITELKSYIDIADLKVLEKLQHELEKEIKKDIYLALTKTQKTYNSDVWGFGAAVYREYPKYWNKISRNWKEKYPEVETIVKVKSVIKSSGLIA